MHLDLRLVNKQCCSKQAKQINYLLQIKKITEQDYLFIKMFFDNLLFTLVFCCLYVSQQEDLTKSTVSTSSIFSTSLLIIQTSVID